MRGDDDTDLCRGQYPDVEAGQAATAEGSGLPMISLTTILIVILILMLVGSLPTWGYSRAWGPGPSGLLGVVLVVILVLWLVGRI
jgi:hypothetical protein